MIRTRERLRDYEAKVHTFVVTVSIIYTALPVFAIHVLPETTEVDAPRKEDETKAGQRLRWVTWMRWACIKPVLNWSNVSSRT